MTGGSITTAKATSGKGGILRITGGSSSTCAVTIQSSATITSCTANSYGGCFTLETTTSTLNVYSSSSISTVIAGGRGGIANFEGTTNYAYIKASTISSVTTSSYGGLFSMMGTSNNGV